MRVARLPIVLLCFLFGACAARAAMPIAGGDLYYIVNKTIVRERISDGSGPEVIFNAEKYPEGTTNNEINGLTLGRDNTLLFHMVVTKYPQQTGQQPSISSSIYSYDLSTGTVSVHLSLDTIFLSFASVSADGRKLAVTARDSKHASHYIIVRDYASLADSYFDGFPLNILKIAWSLDDNYLFLSGAKEKDKHYIFELNVGTGQTTRLFEGIMPVPSKSGEYIAYSSSDRQKLMVSNTEGRVIQELGGHLVRDIYQWVNDKYVLFSVGKGFYVDEIMLADLEATKTYTISNQAKGEISGCVLIEHK